MPQLRDYEAKIKEYFKISSSKFDSLLGYIKDEITKQDTNLRQPIAAEERFVVCHVFVNVIRPHSLVALGPFILRISLPHNISIGIPLDARQLPTS